MSSLANSTDLPLRSSSPNRLSSSAALKPWSSSDSSEMLTSSTRSSLSRTKPPASAPVSSVIPREMRSSTVLRLRSALMSTTTSVSRRTRRARSIAEERAWTSLSEG